jgi:endonuclease/exonuclease/phosphatase (EEP) superfamily protein YafD
VKVISWNLLRRTGAAVRHVAALIEHERPDLMLMQEATKEMEALPALAGGHFHRLPWASRIHGLAVWCPRPLAVPRSLPLPASRLPGRLPRRVSQIVQVDDMLFANVHLSHGQLLNRRQLARIAMALQGHPAAIIGDYNAVGPILMSGFKDVGPRLATHFASNVVPFRLDRCLVRGLKCTDTHALEFGPSDHRPIVLHLEAEPASARPRKRRIIDPSSALGKRIARIRSRLRADR